MPRHQQVTTCRKSGGPLSKHCSCEHCTLTICSVCGAREGGLTTDCPGTKIDFDKQQEIYETSLDFTDERGWHLGEPRRIGREPVAELKRRVPRFAATRLPPTLPRVDPRAMIAPTIDWMAVDRYQALQHELAQKALNWALVDRICEDQSALLTRMEDEIDGANAGSVRALDLHAVLEREKIDWKLTCKRVERCDQEFRQAARQLAAALEPQK
jgi:hypothetical protein